MTKLFKQTKSPRTQAKVDVQDAAGKWVVRDAAFFPATRALVLCEEAPKSRPGTGAVLARY